MNYPSRLPKSTNPRKRSKAKSGEAGPFVLPDSFDQVIIGPTRWGKGFVVEDRTGLDPQVSGVDGRGGGEPDGFIAPSEDSELRAEVERLRALMESRPRKQGIFRRLGNMFRRGREAVVGWFLSATPPDTELSKSSMAGKLSVVVASNPWVKALVPVVIVVVLAGWGLLLLWMMRR